MIWAAALMFFALIAWLCSIYVRAIDFDSTHDDYSPFSDPEETDGIER